MPTPARCAAGAGSILQILHAIRQVLRLPLPNFNGFEHVEPYDVVVSSAKPNGFVNFRWAPSTFCKVMQRCYANTTLTVIAQSHAWAQMQDPSTGYVGFMYRKFLPPGHGLQHDQVVAHGSCSQCSSGT